MKKFAILAAMALELIVCGCGNTPNTTVTTTTSGNWEAQLVGGTGAASQLNFVTAFNVTNTTGGSSQSLNITSFAFFNSGACFELGQTAESESGSATLNTNSAGQVTGSLTYNVLSTTNGNVLALTTAAAAGQPAGGVSGTSNGTTTTTGTLSNGVVWGNWSLSSNDPNCTGGNGATSGTFVMCQGTATCTIP